MYLLKNSPSISQKQPRINKTSTEADEGARACFVPILQIIDLDFTMGVIRMS